MNREEVWQRLLSLESRDATSKIFNQIHARELSARRAKEINAAAKQAREFFRNAAEAAYSVRPLLTFYGVTCLSRSLILLLKPNGGEETLAGSHGLETVDWGRDLNGEVSEAIRHLHKIRIRTTAGLFSDFISQTQNRLSIHVNSAAVDWNMCYDEPPVGAIISLGELFARMPDLGPDVQGIGPPLYTPVSELQSVDNNKLQFKVREAPFAPMREFYEQSGYSINTSAGWLTVLATQETLSAKPPLFVHTYVHKLFQTIPTLNVALPFSEGACFSQLGMTYLIAYFLGMLVRYFPTQWTSLVQSEKGDTWWPAINRAQHLVEESFPELVIELIGDIIKDAKHQGAAPSS